MFNPKLVSPEIDNNKQAISVIRCVWIISFRTSIVYNNSVKS